MGKVWQLQTSRTLSVKSLNQFLLGLNEGMGVGTDSMMPPKIGFVKVGSELYPHEESPIHGICPQQKILKKDP